MAANPHGRQTGRSSKGNRYAHGPLLGKILAFALPLAVTSVLQQLFNSVDAAVASQFVGNDALAGIGATGPLVNLLVPACSWACRWARTWSSPRTSP